MAGILDVESRQNNAGATKSVQNATTTGTDSNMDYLPDGRIVDTGVTLDRPDGSEDPSIMSDEWLSDG